MKGRQENDQEKKLGNNYVNRNSYDQWCVGKQSECPDYETLLNESRIHEYCTWSDFDEEDVDSCSELEAVITTLFPSGSYQLLRCDEEKRDASYKNRR